MSVNIMEINLKDPKRGHISQQVHKSSIIEMYGAIVRLEIRFNIGSYKDSRFGFVESSRYEEQLR